MAAATAPLYDAMATHGPSSPTFIKPEPDDFYKFNKDNSRFHHQDTASYGPWQGHNVNPMDINVGAGNNNMNQYSHNFSNNSMLSDDDILGSLDVNGNSVEQPQGQYQMINNGGYNGTFAGNSLGVFSSTPDGAPIQSPFQHGFDYSQWQANPQQSQQQQQQQQRMSQQMSRSISGHGMASPMTPSMQISSPMHNGSLSAQGHQRNTSGQWENSLGSGYSQPFDSPMGSPATGHVPAITDVLKTHSSPAARTNGKTTTTAEMKKAKRRASHNEVERRRRNHINDRIGELSELVPKHRLEDEAVRRSVANNAAMPLSLSAPGVSPPGLAGSHGRRAGSVSQGPLALDDKDKGPAKGEVLDGAVSWTRDLLWLVNGLLKREQQMTQTIGQLNGTLPAAFNDDERRMLSEVTKTIQHNQGTIGKYTRRDGSDLYVPGHTNHAGERVASADQESPSLFDLDSASGMGSQYINYVYKEEDELPEMEMN